MNKQSLNYLGIGAALLMSGCAEKKTEKPNLIFVFPDQMRGRAMGFIGQEPVVTPNLDKFSDESLVLSEAICNYPISSPFRAMMLTGKYPLSIFINPNIYQISLGSCNYMLDL